MFLCWWDWTHGSIYQQLLPLFTTGWNSRGSSSRHVTSVSYRLTDSPARALRHRKLYIVLNQLYFRRVTNRGSQGEYERIWIWIYWWESPGFKLALCFSLVVSKVSLGRFVGSLCGLCLIYIQHIFLLSVQWHVNVKMVCVVTQVEG